MCSKRRGQVVAQEVWTPERGEPEEAGKGGDGKPTRL